MTVGELIEELKKYPAEAGVYAYEGEDTGIGIRAIEFGWIPLHDADAPSMNPDGTVTLSYNEIQRLCPHPIESRLVYTGWSYDRCKLCEATVAKSV